MVNIKLKKATKKKKIEVIKKRKTEKCRTICICSVTSTIHVLVPILKVLSRLGTVNVISEDKSTQLLSPTLETNFKIGDIRVEMVDELFDLPEETLELFKEYDYNIIITTDFLPDCDIDKYIILNRRHHFRTQIDTTDKRYIPIFSVYDMKPLTKEQRVHEQEVVYVNEKLMKLPPFVICEDYLSTLLMGVGKKEFRVNGKVMEFITNALEGIDGCTKVHIKRILTERGELFVSPN